jgi:DNA polymerase III subunit delta
MKTGSYLEKIQTLVAEVQNNNLNSIYLISGDENYCVHDCQKHLVKSLKKRNNDMEITVFDRDEASVQTIMQTISSPSLFNNLQLVVARDVDWFESKNKQELAQLAELVKKPPESSILVITTQTLDRRLTFVKAVSKSGAHLDFPKVKSYGQFDTNKDIYYPVIQNRLEQCGQTIHYEAWMLMRQLTPDDLWSVVNSVELLSSYIGERKRIEKHDVDKCILDHSDMPGYLFMEALSQRKPHKLKQIIEKTIQEGTHPLALSKMLSNRVRVFMIGCSLGFNNLQIPARYFSFKDQMLPNLAETMEADPVAKQTLASMNPFALYQMLIQLKQFSKLELVKCLEKLALIDTLIKSGAAHPQTLFESQFLPLCEKGRY